METIPQSEWDIYFNTVEEAIAYARYDCAASGFRVLEEGVRRAAEMEDEDEEWTVELARKYRTTLDRFTERYGAKFIE